MVIVFFLSKGPPPAHPPQQPPQPQIWYALESPQYPGRWFFSNPATGVSQWECPGHWQQQQQQQQQQPVAGGGKGYGKPPPPPLPPPPPPPPAQPPQPVAGGGKGYGKGYGKATISLDFCFTRTRDEEPRWDSHGPPVVLHTFHECPRVSFFSGECRCSK